MPSDLKHSKRPALPGLLEGCKEYALRDYSRRGNDPQVVGDFLQSLVDVLEVTDQALLKKDVAFVAMIRKLRTDCGEHFELDVTAIIDHLKNQAR